MKKRHIEIIILFCLIVIIPQLTACNNEVEPEAIPENEGEVYELDDSNIVIDNNSFEESIISDNKYDETPDYLQSISEELSEGDYKVVDLPNSSSGKICGEYVCGTFWQGEEENLSSVISRINLANPNEYYEFDTNKIVDSKGIFPLDDSNIEYYVGYNDKIEKWTINTENNEYIKAAEGEVENIETSQTNIVEIFKDSEYYYFHYILWGDKCTNDGRVIFEDRVYVKDENLNTVHYEDIDLSESATNKLFFDEENRLCFLGYDESGYYIQQIKRNETDNNQRISVGGEWDPQGIWQIYLYNGKLWYVSNGYINKTDIDTGLSEKIFYLSSAGIEADDFIYDWRISSDVIEIIYPEKAVYIKI